jgi:Mg2+-importing ATPase
MAVENYWTLNWQELAKRLGTSAEGLSAEEAARRLREYGRNELRESASLSRLRILWRQLGNPLLLLLVFAAILSAWTGEWIDSVIVLAVVLASVSIGYSREYSAQATVAALQARRTQVKVVRDG